MTKAREYFDFVLGRLAFAGGSYWMLIKFEDGSQWCRIGLGFYWKINQEGPGHE